MKTPDHGGTVRLPYQSLIVCKGEALFDWKYQNYAVAISDSDATAIVNAVDSKGGEEGDNIGSGRRIVFNCLSMNVPVAGLTKGGRCDVWHWLTISKSSMFATSTYRSYSSIDGELPPPLY